MTPTIHRISGSRWPRLPKYEARSDKLLLAVAIGAMVASLVGFFFMLFGLEVLPFRIERPYMVGWVLATGATIVAPIIYLVRKGEFSLFHPLVFAAGTYFFPAFFLGGWSLVFGLSNFYYLTLINDPEYDLPLAFLYVILGFGFLSVGFLISPGRWIGQRISQWLPTGDLNRPELFFGSIVFLIVGSYVMISALELGQIGYQNDGVIYGDTGSLSGFLLYVVPTSVFLLWIAFFSSKEWDLTKFLILGLQAFAAVFMLVVLGGKSSLVQSVAFLVGAYVLLRKKFTFRNWAWVAAGLVATLLAGFIYGATFRSIKGSGERISVAEYAEISMDAFSRIGNGDTVDVEAAFFQFAERIEIGSSLAVVVSNYEALSQYEADYGLENNIWLYTWTGFIPRYLWKDKPKTSDNYSYNELYFGYGGFGLAITSMGDLLRNFGPLGVPLGMLVLGFAIRIFYAAMIEGQPFAVWRSTVYFMVVTKISYDNFYGDILPTTIRIAAVVIAQLLLIKLIFRFVPSRD